MVALAALVMVVVSVPLFHAFPVWVVALERHFTWSRSQLGASLTITRLFSLAAPLEGYLCDRFGPRRMVLLGLCIVAAGFLVFGLTRTLWMFYAAVAIIATGQSLGGFIPLTVMLSRWFVRRRAMAIATSQFALSAGTLVLVPVMAWGTAMDIGGAGWRLTAFVMGGLAVATTAAVLSRMRNRPQDMGLHPDGDLSSQESQDDSFPVAQALRTRSFWLILIADVLASAAFTSILTYLGLIITDKGYSLQNAALVISTYSGVATIFHLVGGYAGDRMPKRVVLASFVVLQALGIVVLFFAGSLTVYFLAAVLMGMGGGGRTPLVWAILPDYFGTPSLGRILGIFILLTSLVSIFISPLGAATGLLRDIAGNFALALLVTLGVALMGAYCFLKARAPE